MGNLVPPAFLELDGCHLAYRVRGTGPPVLFIQGVGTHGDGWSPQTDDLAAAYTCLTLDNRGCSASQPLGQPLSIQRMAADALALTAHLRWDAFHIVGHSMGGLIALHLALMARKHVRSLALLCTFADGRIPTRLSPRMLWIGTRTRVGTRGMRRRAFLELLLPPKALAGIDRDEMAAKLVPIFGRDLADAPPIVMKQLAAMRAYDATARLGDLAGLRTLVVSATHDPIAPPWAGKQLAAGIAGSRFVELADASHGVPVADPGTINRLLREHLPG